MKASLTGRRIVVTRTRDQASELSEQLRGLGAEVLELPVLKISKAIDKQLLADVLLELGRYDWVVFTSANGVRYFFDEFLRVFDDIRSLGLLRIAAIGDGTLRRIAELHLKVEVQPKVATAEALAEALTETGSLDSAQVLVITGNLNRDILVTKLEEARAIVDTLQVYQTEPVDLAAEPAAAEFRAKGADAILFASSSSAEFFAAQAGVLKLDAGAKRPIAGSIGKLTSESMKKVGIPVDFEAKTPGLTELIDALVKKLGPSRMKVPFLDLKLQHAALRESALAALAATYDANRFCLGQDVEDFEKRFAATLGYPPVLGMSSGTAPLHVACMLAGFGPGDEVIAPPFTFISTVWGVSYVGAKPVFCDVEEGTYNLDPAKLEAAITPRTKGIIVVHLFGQPARMDEIIAIARRHNLFVIEDCAQAVGANYRGTPVGIIGDCGTFSFYPTKNLGGCGEGGAFVAQREDLRTRARHIRVHGSDRRYYHDIVGGNFRMDGFQGALLNVKLPHLAAWTARRQAIAARYLAGLNLSGLLLPAQPAYGQSVFHQFTVRHPRRDALRAHLQACAVGTDLIYPVPLHLQKCYADLGCGPGSFPVAEAIAESCVSLPIFPELTDAQVDHVIASINSFR